MKTTKEQLNKMYNYSKNYYKEEWGNIYDMYDLKRFYTDFADEFDLDIAFWVDWCEYGWDDEIYCYTHVDNIWSIVFDWSVNHYTDWNFYKDPVNYLLELQKQAEEIQKKLLSINQ